MQKQVSIKNVNQTVWKLIREDLALQKDLQRKLINMRALANFLIKKHSLTASLDAVISAIRRFQTQEEFKEEEKQLINIFKDSIISTRNNVVCITLTLSSSELFDKLCNVNNNNNAHLKFTTGDRELKIMTDLNAVNHVVSLFPKQHIKLIINDLSEISILTSEKVLHTKGVLARMANELALANINLEEIIICPPEFFLYVKQSDIVKAHDSILKLVQKA
ncbi:hypothetical protein HYV79_01325 [Candidatus Woesearchaeota archaeon]|nr:hypothetical protein [Candidatus Woesearchaeota archaeon]